MVLCGPGHCSVVQAMAGVVCTSFRRVCEVCRRLLVVHPAQFQSHPDICCNSWHPNHDLLQPSLSFLLVQICRDAGIVILEDDAYYWLQYSQGKSGSSAITGPWDDKTGDTGATRGALTPVQPEHQPGLQLAPSFLSLDVDGRVLRIDTFSKLLGPGCVVGDSDAWHRRKSGV
jgi:hypothetical protein